MPSRDLSFEGRRRVATLCVAIAACGLIAAVVLLSQDAPSKTSLFGSRSDSLVKALDASGAHDAHNEGTTDRARLRMIGEQFKYETVM